ncbi:TldD/PmbA family protein [Methanofollis fontis]|uniref:TldD/PmbA family protein n=1 Tax=Methanofollis fontis TaxID=2052832 RepID=A0A483CSC7_9EURY|nr:TldD/PmbA family protein [Methanofollis fontis]TAJ45778.1 TldD/PmbA family protein [Methanofollis fontis]
MDTVRYYDIRHVRGSATHVDIDNGVVESAGTSFYDHAVVRVLGPKGWGILTMENLDPAALPEPLVREALSLALITDDPVDLADAPRGILPLPGVGEDPLDVSLEEKTALLAGIEEAAHLPEIVNTRARYAESIEEVRFCDSSGIEYTYAIPRCGFSVLAVAARNGEMQMGRESHYTIRGLNLRHRQDLGERAAQTAIALLDARAAKGGRMRAVLDPELAGVFAHEAVGHASEGDLIREGNSVLAGRTGEAIGSQVLTIVDDPSLPEFGFEPVDAEGVAVSRTELIRAGRVNAFMHTRQTLAAVGNGAAGHARASAGDQPLVRMSNTYIEEGDSSYDEILAECRSGILLKGSRGGQVDPGRGVFQFNAEYGYIIEDGEIGQMVRDVSLSGDILSTLHAITLVGDDRRMHEGYCGKGGQSVPVSDGSPHIFLEDAMVGGNGSD